MKTAEEWYNELETYNQVNESPEINLSPIALLATIKAIQFDARKQGLEDAYKSCNRVIGDSTTTLAVRYQIHQLIDNLK